jgi:hypothetical protein
MRSCTSLLFTWVLIACAGPDTIDGSINPQHDGGISDPGGAKPAGAACASGSECAGGTCLGAPGQPEEGNPRFAGGYCSAVGCTVDSQDGCGPDEFCIDGGQHGGICVELCSKSEGLVSDRITSAWASGPSAAAFRSRRCSVMCRRGPGASRRNFVSGSGIVTRIATSVGVRPRAIR